VHDGVEGERRRDLRTLYELANIRPAAGCLAAAADTFSTRGDKSMKHRARNAAMVAAWALSLGVAAGTAIAADKGSNDAARARGRYIVTIGGCNDCHTPGFAMSGGKVDEKQWLTGDSLGWRGPWGTTYPVNLRLYMQALSENAWVDKARHLTARPPMPFWALNTMTDRDLRALYRYVRALGPSGDPAPAYVPPNQEPKPPYVTFPSPPK
jgi:mono/diheme cytochrome c family protein